MALKLQQYMAFQQFLGLELFVIVDDTHEQFCPYINKLIWEFQSNFKLVQFFLLTVQFLLELKYK